MNQPSLGVKLFGWLYVLSGIGGVLYVGFIVAACFVSPTFFDGRPQTAVLIALAGASSVFGIFLGRKLLALRPWTRIFILVTTGLGICWELGIFIMAGEFTSEKLLPLVLGVGWGGVIIWYFLRSSVKAQFESAAGL